MSTEYGSICDAVDADYILEVAEGTGGVRLTTTWDQGRKMVKFWLHRRDVPRLKELLDLASRSHEERES